MAAEQRVLAFRRSVLLIEHLAFPAAVRRTVGAEVIEERIAAEDAALVQQQHAFQIAVDAVEHPQVHGIQPAGDAAVADRAARGKLVLVEPRHHRAKHQPRPFRRTALEAVDVALRPAAHAELAVVGPVERTDAGIDVVALAGDDGGDLAVLGFLVGAGMGERGIAAEHLARGAIHHAAAEHVADAVLAFVEPVEQRTALSAIGRSVTCGGSIIEYSIK